MIELRAQTTALLTSLLGFTKYFYKLRTGREFTVSRPIGREPHQITISKSLTNVLRGTTTRLLINCPPRYGKTEVVAHFVAWSLARYPDSNFIYVSYSYSLAAKQTKLIRNIISLPEYQALFGIKIKSDTRAKDDFETKQGGSVYAAGSGGTITGRGAGIRGCDRFGGAVLIDDIHKPEEALSDVTREGVIDWYNETLKSRLNQAAQTPIIFIGQRLHEGDLAGYLIDGKDEQSWDKVVCASLDATGNALDPSQHSVEMLKIMEEKNPYVYYSQYQQTPQPAGGGLFKPEWFVLLDEEPDIFSTFFTCDTAETNKSYNDATVFSFWGMYELENMGVKQGIYGLHWIDCVELRCEPKDLENEFLSFYAGATRHKIIPQVAAIEKKSTGTTLVSTMKDKIRGLMILEIDRSAADGSKAVRFVRSQPYVASKCISFTRNAKHVQMCIDHMKKITLNDTHRFDDIADTLADAIKVCLIDKTVLSLTRNQAQSEKIIQEMAKAFRQQSDARRRAWL